MKRLVAVFLFALISLPLGVHAQEFEVSGWIPYWKSKEGTKDARTHIDKFSVVYPFVFTVTEKGGIKDLGGMKKTEWKRLVQDARSAGVLVIPTVMTSNTEAIHTILSDATLRARHIKAIVDMVKKGKYDGIDIDYEGKRASTKPYFSQFLRELKEALGDKVLSCTIEARTPPEDLYRNVPADLRYANDFEQINDHCDRVNIMTYDQQRADLSLNDARKGAPYIPVADSQWVEKVMKLTKKTIDPEKLYVGVATYGAEWELTVEPEWFKEYKKLWALNPSYAESTAKKEKVTPTRNSAGELSYTYLPKSSKKTVGTYSVPAGTSSGEKAAMQALAYANDTGKATVVHVVWWSDAQAIAQKVALAKKLGLAGVAIFKIDGGEDKRLWSSL